MANEKNNMMEEELDDVLILVDEEDQEHPFQMIDMVEVDGSQYAVLVPLEEGSDEDEAIILKIVLDENGEEVEKIIGLRQKDDLINAIKNYL